MFIEKSYKEKKNYSSYILFMPNWAKKSFRHLDLVFFWLISKNLKNEMRYIYLVKVTSFVRRRISFER